MKPLKTIALVILTMFGYNHLVLSIWLCYAMLSAYLGNVYYRGCKKTHPDFWEDIWKEGCLLISVVVAVFLPIGIFFCLFDEDFRFVFKQDLNKFKKLIGFNKKLVFQSPVKLVDLE